MLAVILCDSQSSINAMHTCKYPRANQRSPDNPTPPRVLPSYSRIFVRAQKAIGNGREDVVHVVHVIRSNGNAIVTAKQNSEHKPTVYGSINTQPCAVAKMAPSNGVGFNRYKETRLLRLVIQIAHTHITSQESEQKNILFADRKYFSGPSDSGMLCVHRVVHGCVV